MDNEEVLKVDGRHNLKGRKRPEGAGRKKTDRLLTNTSFRIDKETLESFKTVCAFKNTTYGKVLRSLMNQYVEEYYKEHPEKVQKVLYNEEV